MGNIKRLVSRARNDLANCVVDKKLLAELYGRHNPSVGNDIDFIQYGLSMFPNLCCGIASVYLRHILGHGQVVTGKYNGRLHTFLLTGITLIDITSDQYGGPPIYIGNLNLHSALIDNLFHSFILNLSDHPPQGGVHNYLSL